MKLPEIGAIVTAKEALVLCKRLKLDYLVERIEAHPHAYKNWKFDGCSGLPDRIMGLFTGCKWENGDRRPEVGRLESRLEVEGGRPKASHTST